MKLSKVALTAIAVMGVTSSVLVTEVQAKTGYRRTKSVAIKAKSFYTTSQRGSAYRANKSLTNFKFKKAHVLKNYRDSTWVATSKMTVKVNGKKRAYYYVRNSEGKAKGWVWQGYLKAGKHHQMIQNKSKQTANYVVAKPGKLYQFGESTSNHKVDPLNIRFKHSVKLAQNTTYQRTQLWTVYKHGKATKYYYVTSADHKTSGWVWHGFLKPKTVTDSAKQPSTPETKPEVGTTNKPGTTNTNNGSSEQPQPSPSKPIQKPQPKVPAWATDDGKRKRLVVDFYEFEKYINDDHTYKMDMSLRLGESGGYGKRVTVNNLERRLDESNPYQIGYQYYGLLDGKQQVIEQLNNSILLNGDVLLCRNRFFVAVGKPKQTQKYQVKYPGDKIYVTWAPTWYQYHVATDDFSSWQFNLKTKQWDETEKHLTDLGNW